MTISQIADMFESYATLHCKTERQRENCLNVMRGYLVACTDFRMIDEDTFDSIFDVVYEWSKFNILDNKKASSSIRAIEYEDEEEKEDEPLF